MKKVQCSFLIEEELLHEIDKIREREERSRNYIVNCLLKWAVKDENARRETR